jgi:putative redox protein
VPDIAAPTVFIGLIEKIAMHGTVKWVDGVMTLAESGSGHSVVMDGPEELGGKNHGLRPMEMLLLGTGGCALFDVVTMLKKSRQSISNCRVELQAERSDGVPAVFTAINLHFVVEGEGLKDNQVARAVQLSAEKYCSASIMLATGGVKVTHSHETHAR